MADTQTTLDRSKAASFDTYDALCAYARRAGVPQTFEADYCENDERFYLMRKSIGGTPVFVWRKRSERAS